MDLEHTITRLAAIETIRDLIVSYSHLIDRGAFGEVAELFAHAVYGQCDTDGTPVGPLIVEDARAVLSANQGFVKIHGTPGTPGTKHLTTNIRIQVADNGTEATALSYVTVLQAAGDLPLQPILTGRYFDEFAVADGSWRFTRRLVCIDHVGDLSEHARQSPPRH
ncbi:nuclear transport factor 2 family protein [Nocardia sp. NPDC001965]